LRKGLSIPYNICGIISSPQLPTLHRKYISYTYTSHPDNQLYFPPGPYV